MKKLLTLLLLSLTLTVKSQTSIQPTFAAFYNGIGVQYNRVVRKEWCTQLATECYPNRHFRVSLGVGRNTYQHAFYANISPAYTLFEGKSYTSVEVSLFSVDKYSHLAVSLTKDLMLPYYRVGIGYYFK